MFPFSHWCNVLTWKTFDQLGLKRVQLQSSKTNLLSYGGHKGKHVGNITLQCKYKNIKYQYRVSENTFEVVDLPSEPILGSTFCSVMGLFMRAYKLDCSQR